MKIRQKRKPGFIDNEVGQAVVGIYPRFANWRRSEVLFIMINAPAHIEALGDDFVNLWRDLSVFPTREEVSAKIRVYKPRTLANLDCQGRGPGGRMRVGGKVCYPRDEVILWFASQVKEAA